MVVSKEMFDKEGYVLYQENQFSEKHVKSLYHKYLNIFNGVDENPLPDMYSSLNGGSWGFEKLDQVHLYDDEILALIKSEQLKKRVFEVTKAARASVFVSHMFYKPAPPHAGALGRVGWHTDDSYVRFQNGYVLTVWLPLNDMKENSGTLTLLKGSHKWQTDIKPEISDGENRNLEEQARLLRTQAPSNYEWEEHQVLIEAGGLSFHHPNTWHYSKENLSDQPRLTISLALFLEHDHELNVPVVIKDNILSEEFNQMEPLVLYDKTTQPIL